jgi:hypothetical protein
LVAKVPGDTGAQGSTPADLSRLAMVEEHVKATVFDTAVKKVTANKYRIISKSIRLDQDCRHDKSDELIKSRGKFKL